MPIESPPLTHLPTETLPEAMGSPLPRATAPPLCHAANALNHLKPRCVHDSATGDFGIAVRFVDDHGRPLFQEPPCLPSRFTPSDLKVLTMVSEPI